MAEKSFFGSLFDAPTSDVSLPQDVSLPEVKADRPEIKPEIKDAPKASGRAGNLMPPEDMRPIFEAAAKEFNVPVNVLMALSHQESRFNPNAVGQPTQWGRAKGLMQYLDSTAAGLGINPFDPAQAIPAAAKQLSERLRKGYSMEDAVKEHFAGPDRRQWGEKTAAYGREVMEKVGKIGELIEGGNADLQKRLDAEEPGRYRVMSEDQAMSMFSPNTMSREAYEGTFLKLNPNASQATIDNAMGDYDKARSAKMEIATSRVQNRFDTLQSPEAMFEQRLNRRLQGPANGIVPQLPEYEKEKPEEKDDTGDFMRRFYDSGRQAKALAEGTLGLFGDISERNLGIGKDLKDWGYRKYREDMAITEKRAKPYDDALYVYERAKKGDFGPVVDYLQGGAGYLTGQALEAVVATVGGAVIGTAAGTTVPGVGNAAGAVGGGIAGAASKTAVKKILGNAIEKRLAAYAAEAAAKGMAEAEARQYAKQVLGARVLGALAGSQAFNLSQELGTTYGGARDEKNGGDLTGKEVAKATAAGTAAAAIETLGDAFGFSRFLKSSPTPRHGIAAYIEAIAKEAGINMTSEGIQELAQTALERYGSGKDLTNKDAARDYINSVLLGSLGGAARGTIVGAINNRKIVTGSGNEQVDQIQIKGDQQENSTTVVAVPAEKSTAAGPLTRAIENAADQHANSDVPPRVTVVAPEGTITGFAQDFQEDDHGGFMARVLGDDGQVYQFTDNGGVQITVEQKTQAGPLTSAVEQAAEEHAQQKQAATDTKPEIQVVAEKQKVADVSLTNEGETKAAEPAAVEAQKFNANGLQPGTPEYEAAFSKWSEGQQEANVKDSNRRQRDENKKAAEIKNGWRKKVLDWFIGAQDGDTITTNIEDEEYRVIEKEVTRGGKKIKQKILVAVGAHGEGRDMTIAEMRDGELYGVLRTDIGIDEDTGSIMPESDTEQRASTLGMMLESGEAKGNKKKQEVHKSEPIDLTGRTDQQLQYLSEKGHPGFKEAAVAELAKRKQAAPELRLEDMDEPQLRARMKYITGQAKANGGWNKLLTTARKEVEREINRRKEATSDQGTDTAAVRVRDERAQGAEVPAQAQGDQQGAGAASPATGGEQRSVSGKPESGDGTAVSGAGTAADAKPALNDIGSGRWFSTKEKADAFIAKKKAGATHEVVQTGKVRFEVKPKVAEGMERFPEESGSLGIPRSEMPQVPSQSHGALVNHLNAQGIEHETKTIPAADLKPTQAEFSPEKVEKAKDATGDRAVIVSNDGHIIDGHHQALAAADEGKDVKAIVLDAPVEQALEAVKNSPSAQSSQEAEAAPASAQQQTEGADNGMQEGRRQEEVAATEAQAEAKPEPAAEKKEGKFVYDFDVNSGGRKKPIRIRANSVEEAHKKAKEQSDGAVFERWSDDPASIWSDENTAKRVNSYRANRTEEMENVLRKYVMNGGEGKYAPLTTPVDRGSNITAAEAWIINKHAENVPTLVERGEWPSVNAGGNPDALTRTQRQWIEKNFHSGLPGWMASLSDADKAKMAAEYDDTNDRRYADLMESIGKIGKQEQVQESGSAEQKEAKKPTKPRKAVAKKYGEAASTEDAGEELKFNKRNRKAALTWDDLKGQDAALRVSSTTKAKVLEKPDYQALIDGGMDTTAAYVVKQVYDSISAKPQTRLAPTDEQLQQYIAGANRVMSGVVAWANGEGGKAWVSRMGSSTSGQQGEKLLDAVYPEGWRSQQDELRLIGSNKVLAALQPGLDDARKAGKEIDKGWPAKMEAWQKQGYKIAQVDQPQLITTNYYEGKRSDGTPYVSVRMTYSKNRQQFLLYGAVIEAESKNDEAVTQAVDAVTEDAKAGKHFLIGKAGNAIGSYDTLEAAQEAARDKAKRDTGGNVIDERGISVEMARRTGKERRMEGEDVTSERLMEEFGFRGVNFGNWLKGKSNSAERQLHLNHAYDSFMDLADVLGVPPKAMSLNGMLGIAIGAQGNGKAAAHFVPGLNEINITRTAGAGALAHEWGHALDHYFARLAGLDRESEPFLTEHATMPSEITRSVPDPENPRKLKTEKSPRFAAELRPEILEKFKAIVTAMNKRELTPGEIEMRRTDSIANAKKQLDGWLASIKRDFRSPSMVNAGKAVPEADFDALAERIRKLDLGDGTVALGKTAYVSPVVDELRGLYKKATGSTYSIDNIKSLQQWIDYLKHVSEEKADAKTHVPQTTTTTFAAEAAKLDKDKGGKKYWSTDIEKFARAFDAYVSDKLAEKAMKNTYLAGLNNDPMTSPMGEERKAINKAFDGLVETIETREEGGKIVLSDTRLEGEEDAADNRGGDGRRVQGGNDAGDAVQQADARRREAFESLREFAGIAIATRIENQGASALVGASAGSPKDLAAAAQIYRNPRFETSRVVFVRGGRVVFEAGVTSRLPGYVAAVPATMGEREFYRWIGDQKDRLNADGYYLMHNHPSGDPTPSGDDVAATVKMAGEVAGFLGHVIINSNKYAVIDANGNGEVRTEYFGEDNLLKASKPHELLNRQLASMEDLAVLGKSLQQDGYVTLIGIASKKIRAITSFPLEQYKTAKDAKIATRYVARKSGSSQVFVVGDVAGIQHHQELIENGFIAAAIDADGKLIYGRVRQGMQFGINANDVAKMSTRGEAANADAAAATVETEEGPKFSVAAEIGNAIEVDGVLRSTTNSNGKPIAQTEEGLRNFWRWFGNSRVVDGKGRPRVVYHGTGADFTEFDLDADKRGVGGWWFSDDYGYSSDYFGSADGEVVLEVYIKATNPFAIDVVEEANRLAEESGDERPGDSQEAQDYLANFYGGGRWDYAAEHFVSEAKNGGNDALVITSFADGRVGDSTAFIVWDARAVKSAFGSPSISFNDYLNDRSLIERDGKFFASGKFETRHTRENLENEWKNEISIRSKYHNTGQFDSHNHDIRYSVNSDGNAVAEFGPVHTEYKDDPAGAIDRLMTDKTGEAIIDHPQLGEISLIYSEENAGLQHIAERRGAEFMRRLPDLLKNGVLFSKTTQRDRVFIGNDRDEAVVRLDWNKQAKAWLLSAYEKYPDLSNAGDVMQSRRSQTVEQRTDKPMTKADLQKSITSGVIGSVVARMIDAGVIQLHDTARTLPKEVGKNVRGIQAVTMPDGTIHMVANTVARENARGVLLHEMFHRVGEKLIGSTEWSSLMGRLGSLYRQSEQSTGRAREFFDQASARVAAAKKQGAVPVRMEVEEFAAYTIEEYERAPESLPAAIRKWVEDLIGMVKAWMVKAYGKQIGQVTPAQLAAFAKLAVMDVAIARRGEMFGPIGELFSAQAITKTTAFKRWFGNSAVVDANGEPLVVYHGSPDVRGIFAEGFKAKNLGSVFFAAADYRVADSYADDRRAWDYQNAEPHTIPLYLSIQNPMVVDAKGAHWRETERHVQEAKNAGYDGIIIKNSVDFYNNPKGIGKTTTVYAWFSPTQAKSAVEDQLRSRVDRQPIPGAIGNNGDFDPANPDIRYSVAPEQDQVTDDQLKNLTPDEQGLLRRVQSALQDNMNRLKEVQDRIKKLTGLNELGSFDYYRAEANRPGRIAARLEDGKNQFFEPLMKELAEAKKTPEQLEELLHAMHAKERNERIAKINDDMPDGGSGMMTADAEKILDKYRDDKELHDIADKARLIAKETLALKHAYGLIDDETLKALNEAYEFYVPLKGEGEFGPKIKRAMGHESRDERILDNIARDYNQAIVVGEKNLARQSLLKMVLKFNDDALWTARVPPKGRYIAGRTFYIMQGGNKVAAFDSLAQATAYVEGAKGLAEIVDAGGEKVAEYTKPLQDNEVMVYVKGQPVRIQIKDAKLATQLRPLDQARMNPILEAMRGLNQYLAKIYTGYNPAFMLRNMVRDSITGTINILGREGAKTAAQAWKNYPKAISAIGQWAATKQTPNTETGKYLNQYRMYGGKVGASWMSDLEQQGKTLQRMYEDAYGASGYLADGKKGKAALVAGRKIIGGMAHAVEIGNQATENALRLALFITLREQGVSAPKAAQAAKTVTVDFDRKGTATPALGAIYLFINPSIQGTANAMNTLVNGEHKAEAWTALAALAALGMYAAFSGMDDDKDRWLGQSWDSRTKNFILNVGGHEVRVPISYEFAPYYAFGIGIGEALRGEKPMRSAHNIVSSFIDAYFPLPNAYNPDSDNKLMDAAMSAVPTAVKPAVEIGANRNTFGSQIVPESEFTKDNPDTTKMYRATKGSVYDAAAQVIAAPAVMAGISGQYENDLTKVSPETVKYLWRTYTGGLGQFITDTIGAGWMAATDPEAVTSSDVPFVKDFYKANDVKPIRSRYYNLAREAKAAAAEFKQAAKFGDGKSIEKILADDEKMNLISVSRSLSKLSKSISDLRNIETEINADKNLSVSEKRKLLKENEAQQEELYRAGISMFRKDGS